MQNWRRGARVRAFRSTAKIYVAPYAMVHSRLSVLCNAEMQFHYARVKAPRLGACANIELSYQSLNFQMFLSFLFISFPIQQQRFSAILLYSIRRVCCGSLLTSLCVYAVCVVSEEKDLCGKGFFFIL